MIDLHRAVKAIQIDLLSFARIPAHRRIIVSRWLIQYHGWSDAQISPGNSIQYYNRVLRAIGGADKINGSYRLFMAPGMAHCGGGEGPNTFDAVGALEQWVENGSAPDQIIASHSTNGVVDRTRPLCPYPQVAAYKGTGSTDEAANFVCKAQ